MAFDVILYGLFSPKCKLINSDEANVWVKTIINGMLSKICTQSIIGYAQNTSQLIIAPVFRNYLS